MKTADYAWADAADGLRQYVYKILTPEGSGTGFLLTNPNAIGVCGIATAYHVVSYADQWDLPIKVIREVDSREIRVVQGSRFIFNDSARDVALVMFHSAETNIPEEELRLGPRDRFLRLGLPVAWMGYPSVARDNLCYFGGRVSCVLEDDYLVDGVAINGVSGGPAFTIVDDRPSIVGVVTAYMPNRATGEALPGLCRVTNAQRLHDFAATVRSLEEARQKASKEQDAKAGDGAAAAGSEPKPDPDQALDIG